MFVLTQERTTSGAMPIQNLFVETTIDLLMMIVRVRVCK
jgi:hypothetical protein